MHWSPSSRTALAEAELEVNFFILSISIVIRKTYINNEQGEYINNNYYDGSKIKFGIGLCVTFFDLVMRRKPKRLSFILVL